MLADMNIAPVRRPLLPEHPGAWLFSRARVYLVVLGAVIAGFFFFAGWLAGSDADSAIPHIVAAGELAVFTAAAYKLLSARQDRGIDHGKVGRRQDF